jgi:DNA-binding transcriptional LysR family regulator
VRLGVFLSAGATLLPTALTWLAATSPYVTVTTREGTTPALVRALRAGSVDLAVLVSRPPHRPFDDHSPRLHLEPLDEAELLVAGFGVTTVPSFMARVLPPGVALLRVEGAPPEIRRLNLALLPGHPSPAVTSAARAIASAV